MAYPDLHDHVRRLDEAGLLVRVSRPIDKNTELHPLVRWQFCGGIPPEQRKAFLFENVVDGQGQEYGIPVLVGALASNRNIYALSMGCELDEVGARWERAIGEPIEPKLVEDAACQELVFTGDDLANNGLDAVTTDPGVRCVRMRDRPARVVECSTMNARPLAEYIAPRAKSACPPEEDQYRPATVSDAHWP